MLEIQIDVNAKSNLLTLLDCVWISEVRFSNIKSTYYIDNLDQLVGLVEKNVHHFLTEWQMCGEDP